MRGLGHEGYKYYFDPQYRDVMEFASNINDMCDFKGENVVFTRVGLRIFV